MSECLSVRVPNQAGRMTLPPFMPPVTARGFTDSLSAAGASVSVSSGFKEAPHSPHTQPHVCKQQLLTTAALNFYKMCGNPNQQLQAILEILEDNLMHAWDLVYIGDINN